MPLPSLKALFRIGQEEIGQDRTDTEKDAREEGP